ncbi:MAG: hypothetical protein AVDCRST_MAG79-1246, partial [uncultured Thermoleophilia bacterium]
ARPQEPDPRRPLRRVPALRLRASLHARARLHRGRGVSRLRHGAPRRLPELRRDDRLRHAGRLSALRHAAPTGRALRVDHPAEARAARPGGL